MVARPIRLDPRTAPRISISLPARLCWGEHIEDAMTINISNAGAFFECYVVPEAGTEVRVEVDVCGAANASDFSAAGVVRRSVDAVEAARLGLPTGVGVEFERHIGGSGILDRLIRTHSRGAAARPAPVRQERSGAGLAKGLPVRWGHDRADLRRGHMINVVGDEVFVLQTEERIEEGSSIYVSMRLPIDGSARSVRGIGVVVRSTAHGQRTEARAGIRFETITEDVSLVRHYVRHRREWIDNLARPSPCERRRGARSGGETGP